MIDRKIFFDTVRRELFDGFLHSTQVDGMGRILDEWERRKLTDARWLAYMLATTIHETAEAMVPIKEAGSESYLRHKPYWPWIGEGLVQVTLAANERKFGATKPGDCMGWPVALHALFDGMITDVGLRNYFGPHRDDPVSARLIINVTDRAQLVAGYLHLFLHALTLDCDAPSASAAIDKPAPKAA